MNCFNWDQDRCQIAKEKIQIKIKKNNEIIYSQSDVEILRIQSERKFELSFFIKQQGLDQKTTMDWSIEIIQQIICEVEFYSVWRSFKRSWWEQLKIRKLIYINDGLKQGVWKELIQQYSRYILQSLLLLQSSQII
ncbi:unnamed protein product [Paramecium octaurelia]|uniref:Uncharacterized protein n=1 Tax=Paramecium octaurelia TaxID=43137 RepID=A0A8S1XVJ0_PAROT|nr:unnamed protein product [Paramecium octaurelia]